MDISHAVTSALEIVGVVLLCVIFFFLIIGTIVFLILRKKYLHYKTLWSGRRNFFTVIIVPLIEFIWGAWNYTDKSGEIAKSLYSYETKQFIMTKVEHYAFMLLNQAVGDNYYIFPQVHISTFIDWKVKGQNWSAAMRHINQKSVDFLLCDKVWVNPKLAIELDDTTHEREDRIERDTEVERILASAHFPLLRITHSDLTIESLKALILKQK